jgi:AraC family transcriptional regulator
MAIIHLTTGEHSMDVAIETLPARRLATVRHVGPYTGVGAAFHRLGTIASAAGLYDHVDPRMIALYHDDPETTAAAELRADAALILRDAVAVPAGLTEATLPAGRYARATHRGAYSGLGDAWARLMGEWLPRSGYRVGAGASYEMYVNNPLTTATEDLHTDLYLLLAD